MRHKILDIWAIQNYPNELFSALHNIKSDDSVIFENIKSVLYVGDKKYSTIFGTVVYSEESDVMIMLMRSGRASIEQVEKYFNKRHINYNKVVFLEQKNPIVTYDVENKRELWFARDDYVVADALDDSKRKNKMTYTYEPEQECVLKLKYPSSTCRENICYERVHFTGALTLEDKMVLIVNDNGERLDPAIVHEMLDQKGFLKVQNLNSGI